jgi:hypothetical protein
MDDRVFYNRPTSTWLAVKLTQCRQAYRRISLNNTVPFLRAQTPQQPGPWLGRFPRPCQALKISCWDRLISSWDRAYGAAATCCSCVAWLSPGPSSRSDSQPRRLLLERPASKVVPALLCATQCVCVWPTLHATLPNLFASCHSRSHTTHLQRGTRLQLGNQRGMDCMCIRLKTWPGLHVHPPETGKATKAATLLADKQSPALTRSCSRVKRSAQVNAAMQMWAPAATCCCTLACKRSCPAQQRPSRQLPLLLLLAVHRMSGVQGTSPCTDTASLQRYGFI